MRLASEQFVRAVAIGGLLVAVLLFSAWQHFELVQHGYLMERLQQERAAEEEINRHLKLEIATLRAPRRIEDMATRELRMVQPEAGRCRDHRAGGDSDAACEVHRRGSVAGSAPLEDRWRTNRLAEDSGSRGRRAPPRAGAVWTPHPFPDWRRHAPLAARRRRRAVRVWTGAIEARLLYLQVFQHDEMVKLAQRPAREHDRADRRARRHRTTATATCSPIPSTPIRSIADPTEIENADTVAASVCAALDRCDAAERAAIARSLRRKGQFAWVARKVSPDEERRVRALELKGIGFVKESRRFYPKRELLAHVLGYVGLDDVGLAGSSRRLDSHIRGLPGKVLIQLRRQAPRA